MKFFRFIPLAAALAVTACTDDTLSPTQNESMSDGTVANSQTFGKATNSQAESIAAIFATSRGTVSETSSNKALKASPAVTSVSYYVDGADTLLYAFNYGDNEGYVVLDGSLSSFPIIAQADTGSVSLTDLDSGTPFGYLISQVAESVRTNLDELTDTATALFWSDVDNPNYVYTVDIVNDAATNKSHSTTSTGWEHIFPSTGNQIGHRWYQGGDFDYAAKNGAHIGCPAVAIGMLLYDVRLRDVGTKQDTWPQFTWADTKASKRRSVSERFRQIADMIPNYKWGSGSDLSSGAKGDDIVAGLRALGFPNANITNFNLAQAYKEMTFTVTDPTTGKTKTRERGILLCGSSGYSGHIWFCDGYQEVKYQVSKTDKTTGKVSQITEYESQLFMNWGQKSTYPGYVAVSNNRNLTGCTYKYSVKMITGLTQYTKIEK